MYMLSIVGHQLCFRLRNSPNHCKDHLHQWLYYQNNTNYSKDLRSSLLRYHFLRAMDLPVAIIFGARLKDEQEGGGIGGHAWLTLDDKPYYEAPGDYEGFVEMYVYPATTAGKTGLP